MVTNIIIEGIDKTGKTTLAKELAKELAGTLIHNSQPEPDSDLFEIYKNQVTNNLFNTIIDRWAFSEIIYGSAIRGKSLISFHQLEALIKECYKNSIFICMTAPIDIVWQRCEIDNESYMPKSKAPYLNAKFIEYMQMFLPNFHILNSALMSPQKLAKEVLYGKSSYSK